MQLRRSIRKKHTLPYYKFRYKPFFTKPEPELASHDVCCKQNKITVGVLTVRVVSCSRLAKLPPDSQIYCTIALGAQLLWLNEAAAVNNAPVIVSSQTSSSGVTSWRRVGTCGSHTTSW